MSFIDSVKNAFRGASQGLQAELQKFKSKDLLVAISAGAVMVAYADGEVSSSEKQKLLGYIRGSEQLQVFGTDQVIDVFSKQLNQFEFDTHIATGEALQKISAFAGKPEAHLIAQVCIAIAKADGRLETAEVRAVENICNALGLSASAYLH